MRTSNKILLSVFLVVMLIPTFLHVALYAKYKSGIYVSMKNVVEDQFVHNHLKTVHYVVAHGLENFTIIPSDTLQLEIEKDSHGFVKFEIIGDSLVIHGDSTIMRPNRTTDVDRSSQQVNLYLPSAEKIALDYCDVTLRIKEDSTQAKSFNFDLYNSSNFQFSNNDYQDSSDKYINSLSIKAAHSSRIEFSMYKIVKNFKLDLSDSQFDDKNAQIEKLSINADKLSSITLKGDNLTKLNATKQQ